MLSTSRLGQSSSVAVRGRNNYSQYYTTMDPLTEDLSRPEEMRMLTPEDISEPNVGASDEVENLQNSLREAVHNENIQPKMQCLMMDSSFSMVTMQGEDSGIEWETTASRCTTPWASEAGSPPADLSTPVATGPAPPAGKIIFVMDEELISRQKKSKERAHGSKGKAEIRQDYVMGSSDDISGRPELVSFSEPNIKADTDEMNEDSTDPSVDKEQKLFRLVSEGSEILNIIVPPKIATVDEEESKEMEDNLSYLEASLVVKANEEIQEQQFEMLNDVPPAPVEPAMDPPGAPVPKPSIREAPSNVDYFEAFTLIDAQAPGSPAVTAHGHGKTEATTTLEIETPRPFEVTSATAAASVDDNADNISLVEMTSELLDDVFYGTTNDIKTTERTDSARTVPSRLSLKQTGSALFGSQEDILTPIYLPDGPPKIIDPILLEEPKAMAFLYTDLYEEAIGSRKKEEDTESVSSEKSFHSRHSDREARGYLEKYVLIDETPVIEVPQSDTMHYPEDSPCVIPEDLYDLGNFVSKSENFPDSEDQVTDFFRSSASSSPCVLELSPQSTEEEDQTATKTKAKTKKSVVIVAEKVPECTTESLSEFTLDNPDWEVAFGDPIFMEKEDEHSHPSPMRQPVEVPVAPPRKKSSSRKACLDLAPLTPVDVQEDEKPGGKEQCEEEKETASPAETADEGDGEETMKTCCDSVISQDTTSEETVTSTTDVEAKFENVTVSKSSHDDNLDITINEMTETEQNAPEEADTVSPKSTNMETKADSSTVTNEPVNKGQCIIL